MEISKISDNEERLALKGRRIALGITGSIASYKAADIASQLRALGAIVEVLLTKEATRFITPLTLHALTGIEPIIEMANASEAEAHVEVARRIDAMIIAPATANCIANLAHGQTNDAVTLTALATTAPILIAPAMDNQMWLHSATQTNIQTLTERDIKFIGPEEGRLASGRIGLGRLSATESIIGEVRKILGALDGDLRGTSLVVTAGGTEEALDPVRYIGNRSSGKMGFALAQAGIDRGAKVTLVSAPSNLQTPIGANRTNVTTASEMFSELQEINSTADVLIMAAAPADFSPSKSAKQKLKKTDLSEKGLILTLEPTTDILANLNGPGIRVGFAAETEHIDKYAKEKLKAKKLHFIVANDVSADGSGFNTETNEVTIFSKNGDAEQIPLLSKYTVAHKILDRIARLIDSEV
tara:strand:- start:17174 stop:18412 length:1239 start_codon:yes stop_codon:yes gene_type:complete